MRMAPLKEVMQHKFNGILTDFFDVDALVKNINDVLDNQDKYKLIRENAREFAVKNYSLKDLNMETKNTVLDF